MKSPIFSSWFQDRSQAGSNDIAINLYPEHVDGKNGPEIGLMLDRGGLVLKATIGPGPIRGLFVARDNNLYLVSGNQFYRVTLTFNATFIGLVNSITGPVSMVGNTTQILIVDGVGGWCYDMGAQTYAAVIPNSETDARSPNVAIYQDGFGLTNSASSNIIYQSNYNDLSQFATPNGPGLGATANDAFAQQNANNIVTMFDMKDEVWVFKRNNIEVWINQGNAGFSFDPLNGVSIPLGCCAAGSVAKVGDRICWLGSDEQGDGVVYLQEGYNAKPISTSAITNYLQTDGLIISDAIAYGVQRNLHWFYVLTFPTANITYVFDLTTNKWIQFASFVNGQFNRELPNCQAFFNGDNIVGDYQNGNVYAMSDNVYTDNGAPRKWLRRWNALPDGSPENLAMTFNSLQIMMQTGVSIPSGANPQIMLRWSDDGGNTWTGYFQMSAGKIGQTSWRILQNRLGSTKIGTGTDRVFEISGVDPIPIKITSAEVDMSPS